MADNFRTSGRAGGGRGLPRWYDDAKFGIFIHWGVFSIPAWAPDRDQPLELDAAVTDDFFVRNPYVEWYQNGLAIEGSPTQQHHAATYGADHPYEAFAPQWVEASRGWDPDVWADLFQRAGARYVVLVTKHHDGFLLWPSRHANPHRPDWHSDRDFVDELSDAVRARGMRMGLYYSGGLDWTFGGTGIRDLRTLFRAIPQDEAYARYADAHWRELIDRFRPSVLWNDIGYPRAGGLDELFEFYYENVPDGVVNDRFDAIGVRQGTVHADFRTVEYGEVKGIQEHKWEATRGLGNSFGYNRDEPEDRMLSVDRLVRFVVDAASKNGNVLLNVGPTADGTIPFAQAERLLALGWWLRSNGDAVYGTRPWRTPEATSPDGTDIRFTATDDALFVTLLGTPAGTEVVIPGVRPPDDTEVEMLGHRLTLAWERADDGIRVRLPQPLPPAPAWSLRVSPPPPPA